jgi:hypothetical protein
MYDRMLVATLYDERLAHLRPPARWHDTGRGTLAWRIGVATHACCHAATHAPDVLVRGIRRHVTIPLPRTRVSVH